MSDWGWNANFSIARVPLRFTLNLKFELLVQASWWENIVKISPANQKENYDWSCLGEREKKFISAQIVELIFWSFNEKNRCKSSRNIMVSLRAGSRWSAGKNWSNRAAKPRDEKVTSLCFLSLTCLTQKVSRLSYGCPFHLPPWRSLFTPRLPLP